MMTVDYGKLLDKLTVMRKLRTKILNEIDSNLRDINSRDFIVLNRICSEKKEQTMGSLSSSTGLSNALITFSVDNLESKGLVVRQKGKDRRSYFIKVTKEGLERYNKMESIKKINIVSFFGRMNREDFDEFLGLLQKLSDLIEKYN